MVRGSRDVVLVDPLRGESGRIVRLMDYVVEEDVGFRVNIARNVAGFEGGCAERGGCGNVYRTGVGVVVVLRDDRA